MDQSRGDFWAIKYPTITSLSERVATLESNNSLARSLLKLIAEEWHQARCSSRLRRENRWSGSVPVHAAHAFMDVHMWVLVFESFIRPHLETRL